MENENIIDVAEGNVFEEFSDDKVILIGSYLSEKNELIKDLELTVRTVNGKGNISINVPYSGYNFKLFLGDFNGDGKDEIMLRGTLGGSGEFQIAVIYGYVDGKLAEIFNQDMFISKYKLNIKYLNSYKVEIKSEELKESFIMDISNKALDMVYDSNGNVKEEAKPYIAKISGAYPIDSLHKETYKIFVQQKIMGSVNADVLGIVESFLDLTDNKINIIKMGVLNLGQKDEVEEKLSSDEILRKLPSGAELISLDRFGGKDKVISIDLDADGKKEILAAYTLDSVPYVAVFEDNVLADCFEGEGYSLEDMKIIPMKDAKIILVGFKIEKKSNKLEILKFEDGKLKKTFKNEFPIYAEAYVEDIRKDGNIEVILWFHDTGEAYTVNIYNIEGDEFKATNEYDSVYFKKVVAYYKELLKNNKKSSTYLYYLALALEKTRDYEEAINSIEKALETEYPYPSVKELNKIRNRLRNFY